MHKSRTAGLLRLRATVFIVELVDSEKEVEHPGSVRPRRQALPYAIVLFMAVVSSPICHRPVHGCGMLLKFSMGSGERT